MKNKGFLLSLFIAGSLTANAQDIKEKADAVRVEHLEGCFRDFLLTTKHSLLMA